MDTVVGAYNVDIDGTWGIEIVVVDIYDKPTISQASPTNHSNNVNVQPTCSVYVGDENGDSLTVNFYNSTDGITYTYQETQNSVTANTTVQWSYTEASSYNTDYWWKVTAYDGTSNVSEWYNFTTTPIAGYNIDVSGTWGIQLNMEYYIEGFYDNWWMMYNNKTLSPPISFNAQGYNNKTIINLTWNIIGNTTNAYIVRKEGGYPVNRNDGTLVYNGTAESYYDTGLTLGTRYYYRGWGWNESTNSFSATYTEDNAWTCPENITNFRVTENLSGAISLAWTKGQNATRTVIRYSDTAYPTKPSEGTNGYNGTGSSVTIYNLNGSAIYYFSAWAYLYDFSEGYLSVNGTTTSFGSLDIWVYNESNPSIAIENYTVFAKNEDGSSTYVNHSCNNPHSVNLSAGNLPIGNNIAIQVSKDGYHTRIKYMDIEVDHAYNVSFFLPPHIEGGGNESNPDYIPPDDDNITYAEHYIILVVDETDRPLQDVKVTIKRYINETGQYEEIIIMFTDGYGACGVDLIPDVIYLITLEKTGYESRTDDLICVPIIDIEDRYHKYELESAGEETEIYTANDVFDFKAEINETGVITVEYYDRLENTVDTEIRIFEVSGDSKHLNITNSRTGDDDFIWQPTGFNTSKSHQVLIYINHSNFSEMVTISILLFPIIEGTSITDIETRFTNVFGNWDLGWGKTLLVVVPCLIFLVVFGAIHVGLGIITAGLYLGFTTVMIRFSEFDATVYVEIAVVITVIGVLYIILKKGRKAL